MDDVVRLMISGVSNDYVYNIIFQICLTPVFAPKKLILVLYDFSRLEKFVSEMVDCLRNANLPYVHEILGTCIEAEAFSNIDYAILTNSNLDNSRNRPVQDVIVESASVFTHFGHFLNTYSPRNCKVVIYDSQGNLNAFFCYRAAPDLDPRNFSSVLVISQNRAAAQIGNEIRTIPWKIKNIISWGNTNFYQFCDVKYATFGDHHVTKYATEQYRRHCLPRIVQRRGVEVTALRCLPPLVSTAFGVVKHLVSLHQGTDLDDWITMGVVSDGSYGIDQGLVFGFPVVVVEGQWAIVPDLQLDDFTEENIVNSLKNYKQSINLVLSSRKIF